MLVVLAHQDDECIMSSRIEREIAWGHAVFCVFLTDGSGHGVSPRVRDRESRRALTRLGVPAQNLFFPGSARSIPDGRLVLHLDDGLRLLEEAVGHVPFHRVYCLAYEGGHQDHDASHLIALAFAKRRRLLLRTWQLPLYHGYRTPWKLFRIASPLPGAPRGFERRLPVAEAPRHALLVLRFPSQWRTWLVLFPGYLLQRGILRRERILRVDPGATRRRPHEGSLLYERLLDFPYETFRTAADRALTSRSM